jgi:nickel/cobalt transporter (NicO) family protein
MGTHFVGFRWLAEGLTMRSFLTIALFLALLTPLTAHTFLDQRAEREIQVRFSATQIRVKYKLEINAITMALEANLILKKDDLGTIRGPSDLAKQYAKRKAVHLMDGLHLRLNEGERLNWHHREDKLQITAESEQQFIMRFEFDADWQPPLNSRSKLQFEDATFLTVDGNETFPGKIVITLTEDGPGLDVHELNDPRKLQGKSPLSLTPKEKKQLREATAEFTRTPTVEPPPAEPVEAPSITPAKPGLVMGLWKNGLSSLFDSDAGISVLLLAAFVFGAGHAFTPGHGKTLVAAYLVGERGTIRHAILLGASTTLAHTGSVIGVACVLWWFYGSTVPKSAQGWLQLAGGMLIFLVGLWLLLRRVAGKADHVHFGDGHHHHHHHDGHSHTHGPDCDHDHHHHSASSAKSGWWRVVLLGIGGGLIPCWDAVMLLFLAISFGRLAFAIPMLIAFSIGLAAVLVLLGIAVVLAHRAGGKKFGEQKWFQRLPILSAALLAIMGLWLAREGVQMLLPAAPTPSVSTK